jgi:prepilin-type N-terminal cleavage/methylation domain-containing protein
MDRRAGFTLIELMIVVAIMGILVTIAIPNFVRMISRAKEAKVKNAAHMLQLAAEDYAVRHDGIYSDAAAEVGPLLPEDPLGGHNLENGFSGDYDQPVWGAAAAASGEVGIVALQDGTGTNVGYQITGFGKDALVITFSSGQN